MILSYPKRSMVGRSVIGVVALVIALSTVQPVTGQSDPAHEGRRSVYEKKGYTLTFIDQSIGLDSVVKERLVKTFFKVYPKEVRTFNTGAARKVTFIIDPDYKGVAATSGTVVRYSPLWFKSHPEDIDVVTHEAMHIVQAYRSGYKPGWLVEGIADYVRYQFGVNNKAAGWTLPDYNEKQSYKNAYRVTARFLLWVQKHYGKSIVKTLNAALRDGRYTRNLWNKLTGQSLPDLWSAYGVDPVLRLHYR